MRLWPWIWLAAGCVCAWSTLSCASDDAPDEPPDNPVRRFEDLAQHYCTATLREAARYRRFVSSESFDTPRGRPELPAGTLLLTEKTLISFDGYTQVDGEIVLVELEDVAIDLECPMPTGRFDRPTVIVRAGTLYEPDEGERVGRGCELALGRTFESYGMMTWDRGPVRVGGADIREGAGGGGRRYRLSNECRSAEHPNFRRCVPESEGGANTAPCGIEVGFSMDVQPVLLQPRPMGASAPFGRKAGTVPIDPTTEPFVYVRPMPERVVPRPETQVTGNISVSALPCTVDGPPLSFDGDHFDIARAPNGGPLYLIDGEYKLRRYFASETRECRLTLDRSFGEEGLLTLGLGHERNNWFANIDADARGYVYVSMVRGTVRVSPDGRIDRCSDAQGGLSIAPEGGWGLEQGVHEIRKVTFTDDGCTFEPFAYEGHAENLVQGVSFVGEHFYVMERESTPVNFARRYDFDGRAQSDRLGTALNWPCHVAGGTRGPVIVDWNAREVVFIGADDQTLGRLDFQALIGLRSGGFRTITPLQGHVAYVGAVNRRTSWSGLHDGYVFRVSGL